MLFGGAPERIFIRSPRNRAVECNHPDDRYGHWSYIAAAAVAGVLAVPEKKEEDDCSDENRRQARQ